MARFFQYPQNANLFHALILIFLQNKSDSKCTVQSIGGCDEVGQTLRTLNLQVNDLGIIYCTNTITGAIVRNCHTYDGNRVPCPGNDCERSTTVGVTTAVSDVKPNNGVLSTRQTVQQGSSSMTTSFALKAASSNEIATYNENQMSDGKFSLQMEKIVKGLDLNFTIDDITLEEASFLSDELSLLHIQEEDDELSIMSKFEGASSEVMRKIANSPNFNLEELEMLMNPRKDFLIQCQFNDQFCHMETDVDPTFQSKFGVCFSFNGDNKSSQYNIDQSSMRSGLKLLINAMPGDNLLTTSKSGIKVLVHDADKFPFVDSFGLFSPVGSDVIMMIEMAQIERASFGDRKCWNSPVQKYNYYEEQTYSYEGCARSYLQEKTIESCGCTNPDIAQGVMGSNMTDCHQYANSCMSEVSKRIDHMSMKQVCYMECRSTIFKTETSLTSMRKQPLQAIHGLDASHAIRLVIRPKSCLIEMIKERQMMQVQDIFWAFCQIVGMMMGVSAIEISAVSTAIIQAVVGKLLKNGPTRQFRVNP